MASDILVKELGPGGKLTLKPMSGEDISIYDQCKPDGNGDSHWTRPFNIAESVVRCRKYNTRANEARLECGLELLRVKLNTTHGGWLPFLLRVEISEPTSTRRRNIAMKFIEWAKIKAPSNRLEEHHVTKAAELMHSKCFNLKDFWKAQWLEELPRFPTALKATWGGKGWQDIFRVNSLANKIKREIDKKIDREYMGWPPEVQVRAMEDLDLIIFSLKLSRAKLDEITPHIKPRCESKVGGY